MSQPDSDCMSMRVSMSQPDSDCMSMRASKSQPDSDCMSMRVSVIVSVQEHVSEPDSEGSYA